MFSHPLFQEETKVSDLEEDELNADTLSYCCDKSDWSSSTDDNECSNNVALSEFEDVVPDEVSF